jgi:hypothetical protein
MATFRLRTKKSILRKVAKGEMELVDVLGMDSDKASGFDDDDGDDADDDDDDNDDDDNDNDNEDHDDNVDGMVSEK